MNTRKAVIKATGLTYAYEDGFDAVRGVDFEVYEGEFLAILGHNGSGIARWPS